jgi:hypothetical protein
MGRCNCTPGWAGVSCTICDSDLPCKSMYNSTNSTGYCDKTLMTYGHKFFQCEILDATTYQLVGNMTELSCYNMDNTTRSNGTCTFQAFGNYPYGHITENFFCTFDQCKITIPSVTAIDYTCATTHCKCGPHCPNAFMDYVVTHLIGKAQISCNGDKCIIVQGNGDFRVESRCFGGECLPSYIPPPPPAPMSRSLFLFTVISSSVLVAAALVILIVSGIHSKKTTIALTKEYTEMKNEALGAKVEVKSLVYTMNVMHDGKRTKRKILDNINHTFQPGTVTAIMGASGAGKTTVCSIQPIVLLAINTKIIVNGYISIQSENWINYWRDSC